MELFKEMTDSIMRQLFIVACGPGNLPITEIDGIDLSNYVRDPNSYNPIVYIHKRNLKRCINDGQDVQQPKMHNKGQQFNCDDENSDTYEINIINERIRNATTEKTIDFAKTLIPITIPPKSTEQDVYYKIKSTKRSKTENRGCNCKLDNANHKSNEATKKEKSKIDTNKAKEVFKTTEITSQSSGEILGNYDDTHNETLTDLSEFSENKLKEMPNKSGHITTQFIASQSFEALAEENQDIGKIKIQIMTDKERQSFYESISIPLVNSVKDSISTELNKDLTAVKKKVDKFSDKLDNVLKKLNRIENILSNNALHKRTMIENVQEGTSDKQENTAERDGTPEDLSSTRQSRKIKNRQERDDISIQSIEKSHEERGERVPEILNASSLFVAAVPTPVHRPARFCWTDTKLN